MYDRKLENFKIIIIFWVHSLVIVNNIIPLYIGLLLLLLLFHIHPNYLWPATCIFNLHLTRYFTSSTHMLAVLILLLIVFKHNFFSFHLPSTFSFLLILYICHTLYSDSWYYLWVISRYLVPTYGSRYLTTIGNRRQRSNKIFDCYIIILYTLYTGQDNEFL